MATLRDNIAQLANDFATQILAAVRTASLDDIAALAGGRGRVAAAAGPARPAAGGGRGRAAAGGGRRRRSREDIDALGGQILELLQANPDGLRAEQIRAELGVPRRELPRALAAIVENGSARKQGEKRATTYFAGGGGGRGKRGGSTRGAKRGGKKGGKRGGRRTKSAETAAA
jgi:hypothetical protein